MTGTNQKTKDPSRVLKTNLRCSNPHGGKGTNVDKEECNEIRKLDQEGKSTAEIIRRLETDRSKPTINRHKQGKCQHGEIGRW